ncbi:hypothetical protein M569_14293, partial [Genlisea aurea]
LSWNKLSGPIPDFLGQLKGLTYLGLEFNQFAGSIPPSLSQLKNLGGLRLDRNNLTGTIPDSFGDFGPNLTYLYLSHNQLSGELPRSLGKLNLNFIDLSRNKLQGDASFLFGVNKSVNTIDLSRNSFEFDFSNVGFPSFFNNLDINHNKIFGKLPEGLVAISASLSGFNVSYNRLCGKIPTGGNLQSYGPTAFFHNKCLCGSPLPPSKTNFAVTMDELLPVLNAHMDQMADLVEKLTAELRSGLKPAYENFVGFFHAVDWKEPWLVCLLFFHALLLIVTLLSRKNLNFQMCLFLLSLGGVYLAERVNYGLSRNWESFAGQNYFDRNGVFVSVMWSGPLLVLAILILVNTLFSLCHLIVKWKKAELKHRARAAAHNKEE